MVSSTLWKPNATMVAAEAEEEEGVSQMGIEDIVHLAHVLGVARLGKAECVLEVANHTVAGLLEHHDEHGNGDEVELFLRNSFRPNKPIVGSDV